MVSRELIGLALLFGLAAWNAPAKELGIGDPAPKLAVKEFVKGPAVTTFERGRIYVLEFWATWCGPCRDAIPHLTELQKKYPAVVFIGVSVLEENPGKVRPFVAEMGKKMDYRVAIDAVPQGKGPEQGAMAQGWIEAADQDGLPATFIVDGTGNVAWLGHPMDLDAPLAKIVAGQWDLKAAAAEARKEKEQQRRLESLAPLIAKGLESGQPKEPLQAIDKAIAEDPQLEEGLVLPKFALLEGKGGDVDKALAYGQKVLDTTFKADFRVLNLLAWAVVDPEAKVKPDARLVKLALAAAQRADEMVKGKSADIADTLARAYFVSGDYTRAVETAKRAVQLAGQGPESAELKERLEEYERAASKR
jgi:thiol-disulfide isomerase/thioredoxin